MKRINIVKPYLPSLPQISAELKEILANGNLTNNSRYVVEFEKKLCGYLGVNYCVSVANATLGIILLLKALDLKGEVIVPSFTFSATVHSVVWANLKPVFADIDRFTYNIDIRDVERKINPKTSAILAVNTYGNSCDIEALQKIAKKRKLKLIFDSAHAFGTLHKGKRIGGFGDAEVFSFHATKILPAGEGGVIATNDARLAKKLSLYRVFGDMNGDCVFAGLNAKMQEFSAILGLKGLPKIDKYIKSRGLAADILKESLSKLSGLEFQKINENCVLNYQYFPVFVDEKKFGATRDEVAECLLKENIIARKYFYPPVHKFTCYKNIKAGKLKNTDYISKRILCLPIYSDMKKGDIKRIKNVFKEIKKI